MGGGYFGNFGNTIGSRLRIGKPIDPIIKSIDICLNPYIYIDSIIKKYKINLKGSSKTITIFYNQNLHSGIAGRVLHENPSIIEIGPSAFYSETELANTIAHELNHARSYLRGGTAPEHTAYRAGNTLEKYIKGEK